MYGVVYTPYEVADELKIHGVAAAGESHTTEGRGGRRRGIRGDIYEEEINVGADLHGDTGVIILWDHNRICVFGVFVVDTDAESYDGIHPHKILSRNNRRKKGKYIKA